jgi:hypothetical protein
MAARMHGGNRFTDHLGSMALLACQVVTSFARASKGGAAMNPNPQPADVPKIIVAVHDIGDQIANTTVQSVAFRVFDYYGKPPAIPLGRFHWAKSAPAGIVLLTSPPAPDPEVPVPIGFAEVYWADIPRELRTKGFTLEEAKQWARTIIARLNVKAKASSGKHMDYRMLETVVDELVDAVFVLERLTFLADYAGLFKFELKKVLNDFINDVQVVTEFKEFREGILKKFDDVMKVIAEDPEAEIYIVGHSEGSVVAYFGLLKALSSLPTPPAWVNQVRGLMTIGSPIETHLLLWADLWKFTPSSKPPRPRIGSSGGTTSIMVIQLRTSWKRRANGWTKTAGRPFLTRSKTWRLQDMCCPARRTSTIGRTRSSSRIFSRTW